MWRETSLLVKLAKVGRVRNDAAATRANERAISPSSLFITEQHWLTGPFDFPFAKIPVERPNKIREAYPSLFEEKMRCQSTLEMSITTPVTQLLGINHPILLAPMDLVADGRLVAAVDAAGGFGILGGGYGEEKWLVRELNVLDRSKARLA
jgi:Nitronate monooxygenase